MSKYIGNISISLNAVLPKLPDNHDRAHSQVELWKPRNTDATLLTDTRRRVISLAEIADRMPGVELRKPRNLCVCVSEERSVSEK